MEPQHRTNPDTPLSDSRSQIESLRGQVATDGFTPFLGDDVNLLLGPAGEWHDAWDDFASSWDRLPIDTFMADGGRYRRRRHANFAIRPFHWAVQQVENRPHFQSLDHNPVNGGIERPFESVEPEIAQGIVLGRLLAGCSRILGGLDRRSGWNVEVHQFRVEANDSLVRPVPEGRHRDGVSYVLMMLVSRVGVAGGATTLYDRSGGCLYRRTLTAPGDALFVDDEELLHDVSMIHPSSTSARHHRDMLVVTFARG